jgi:hypothetical protein
MSFDLARRSEKGEPLTALDFDGNMNKLEAAIRARVVVVEHGEDRDAPRPPGSALVVWAGTAEPANADEFDIWAGGA